MKKISCDDFQSGGENGSSSVTQMVYIEFNGAETGYHGELAEIGSVTVQASGIGDDRAASIVELLNEQFATRNVCFTVDKPLDEEYSTIFVGNSDSFAGVGDFLGLSETIDTGNRIRNDNAFVFADSTAADDLVISVIAHETGHLLGDTHAITTGTIADYAASYTEGETDSKSNDSRGTATWLGKISSDSTIKGISFEEEKDPDFYSFSAGFTGTLTISLAHSALSTYMGYLEDSQGNKLGSFSFNASTPYSLQYRVEQGKSYYIYVANNSTTSPKLSYTVSLVKGGASTTAPDVTVSAMTLSSSAITANDPLIVDFTIKNKGSASATNTYAYVYDGGKLLETYAIGTLSANTSKSYSFTIGAAQGYLSTGTHSISVTTACKSDSDNSNNSMSKTVNVSPLAYPDLTIPTFSVSSSSVTPSQSVTVNFTVRNTGNSASASCYAYVYDGSTKLVRITIPAIAVGGSASSSYTIAAGSLSAGSHSLRVEAELLGPELNKSNNVSSTVTVTVAAPVVNYPDLMISSFSASAASITTSQEVALSFTVKNNGSVSAGASTAYIYDGSTKVGAVFVESLSAGSSARKTYIFSAGEFGVGTHNFSIQADGGLSIAESNEGNNTSSTVSVTVTVPQASDLTFSRQYGWSSGVIVHQAAGQSATALNSAANSYLDVCIQNKGKGGAAGSRADVFIDDSYYASFSVAALDSQSYFSKTNIDLGMLSVGRHKITVQIDLDHSLYESNVRNNTISKTVTVKDATPPGKVGTVSSRQENYNVVLSWNAASDNVKVGKYQISWWKSGETASRNASSSKTAYTIGKLAPGTYCFTVTAIDSSRNYGQSSNVYQITVRDVTAPGAVSVKSKVTGNTVDLSWKAPKDNVGVSGYILKYGAGLENTVELSADLTAYRFTGVGMGGFLYQISAVDAAGNVGKASVKRALVKTPLVTPLTASAAETENFAFAVQAAESVIAGGGDGMPSLNLPKNSRLAASGILYGEDRPFELPDPGVFSGGNISAASVAELQSGSYGAEYAARGFLA